jgi:hypothetical protein
VGTKDWSSPSDLSMRILATLLVSVLTIACAEPASPLGGDPPNVGFDELTANPESFDGRYVEVRAGYYAAFEVSVLTSGFAESFPPQPMEPTIWITATPEGDCVERAHDVAWAEAVRASGMFRYGPDGGFGHLGEYEMTLEDASVRCA